MIPRILIISNNVLSYTKNNGKTIYSFFNTLPKENISQLYFSSEIPEIEGYNYFRISDRDIIKGFLNKNRGDTIFPIQQINEKKSKKILIPRNSFTCYIRDILRHNRWKSKKFISWLNAVSPNIVFFMAGDTFFSYEACEFVISNYNCRLFTYTTDDYILPRENDSFLSKYRRKQNFKLLNNCIHRSEKLFVVSPMMKKYYDNIFNVDSYVIVNMTESLLQKELLVNNNDTFKFVYAGSLYFGRDEVLIKLIENIKKINKIKNKKIFLSIYSNTTPSKTILKKLNNENVSKYMGTVNSEELKHIFNSSDAPIFIESFDKKNIEKTRLSLSTKIPEYLSLKKPIIAIGPVDVGSIDYIKDLSFCATNLDKIYDIIIKFMDSEEDRIEMSNKSYQKFLNNHNKERIQNSFIKLLGLDNNENQII